MAEENTGTIDFGIDLGTTTSSIAKIDGNGTVVIPNKVDNRNFVHSAVYIKKNGTIFIGDKAKNMIATDPENGETEFKLKMGTDHVYTFKKSGIQMTPVELSAEILKNLRATVKEKYQKDLRAAVITVPADFDKTKTKATVEAGKLAGFDEVRLLQEPTAAAMAYGFGASDDNEIWLIYDFGGGTFDVSIMKKNGDEIVNINNDGDSYLGGKLIDWDIVDKVLAPAVIKETGLTDFERNNPEYLKQFAKLKRAAETAKTDLSNYDSAEIYIDSFITTDDGDICDFEYDMSKQELDDIMEPYVNRTIDHCKRALKDANLDISDVTKIILVGGSTLSPYIHQRLTDEFNIPLEYSIDPITVVARGAAIFAGVQHYVPHVPGQSDFASVDVKYDVFGESEEFDVSGKIIVEGSAEGYSIEFVNNKTKSESGKIPVNAKGVFMASLHADDENDFNIFEIKIYDATGSPVTLDPTSVNTVKYKIEKPIPQAKMSHTMGLGKYGNELFVIAEKGTPLPFDFEGKFHTSQLVHKGNSDEKVFLPLYEGNRMKADRNTLIGHLTITGDEIRRDLPAESEIELNVSIDESMNVECSVYIEYLDQDFDKDIVRESEQQSRDDLVRKFEEHKTRYDDLLAKSAGFSDVELQALFNRIDDENMIENIENFLKTSETDIDALDNANKRINDLADILDQAEVIINSKLSWDELKKETDEVMNEIENHEKFNEANPEIKNLYNQMKEVYNNAVATKNEKLLAQVKDKVMYVRIQLDREVFVKGAFLQLSTDPGIKFSDPVAAERLKEQGNAAFMRGDIDELERILAQLVKISNINVGRDPVPPKSDPGDERVH